MPSPTAIRTKNHIERVFLDLLEEKNIERITVAEILDAARISRATFYKYFLDKYDVLESVQKKVLTQLEKIRASIQPTTERSVVSSKKGLQSDCRHYCYELINCFHDNRKLLQIMFGPNSYHGFVEKIVKVVEIGIEDLLSNHFPEKVFTYQTSASITFMSHGIIAVLARWILNGSKEPIDTVASISYELLSTQYFILKQN